MTQPALLTDLYQLTMLQAYWKQGRDEQAAFSLYFRRLPGRRNFMLAAGLAAVLEYLEELRFGEDELAFVASQPQFEADFIDWLRALRFTGDVYAMHEGTPVFADEPILEIVAPLPQAQLVETAVMNQVACATVLASKAARVVAAAQGRPVLDFALRRMHGTDAGLIGARAFYLAGVTASSNVLAGQRYGIPIAGTMAHSYVLSSPSEAEAFRAYAAQYPQTVLLVDTYDTLEGVRKVIELARDMGAAFNVRAVRLDSGDLARLSREARALLDEAGLQAVQIIASGGLDEWSIADLLAAGAPIDAFGVGTEMGTSADAPSLDMVYKLVAYAGKGRYKTSAGKQNLPGRKQVFRHLENGRAAGDAIARHNEDLDALPLLHKVMEGGERLPAGMESLEASRGHAVASIAALPAEQRSLERPAQRYPVIISTRLREYSQNLVR